MRGLVRTTTIDALASAVSSLTDAKPVASEVALEDKRARFAGHDATAAKLNADKALTKRIDKLARTRALNMTAKRMAKIVPAGAGSAFTLRTLPRFHALGFKAELDAKEFFDVAGALEAVL